MSERTTDRRRGGRTFRLLLPVLAALLALLLTPGPASAAPVVQQTGFTDRIDGVEYAFTQTVGRFAGFASGPRPGVFDAAVPHTVLNPDATITPGGSFVIKSSPAVVGSFTGGSITRISGGSGCRNEVYVVKGTLAVSGGGTGVFDIKLTHYQRTIAGACRTYFATVKGTVSVGTGASST